MTNNWTSYGIQLPEYPPDDKLWTANDECYYMEKWLDKILSQQKAEVTEIRILWIVGSDTIFYMHSRELCDKSAYNW